MRIEFVHPERAAVDLYGAALRVGSADGNDLVLAGQGVAAHHFTLHRDARGLVLDVAPGGGRVYVNARPVRERALLRFGDTIGVGDVCIRLCSDAGVGSPPSSAAGQPLVASVRACAGPLSGRVWSIGDGLDLGAGSARPLELPGHGKARLHIGWHDGGLWVEGEAPSTHPLRVNGHAVARAPLRHGDQIGVGSHRFVVDASALDAAHAETAEAPSQPLPEDEAGPRGEVWWLIVTAAVLALLIALVLLVRL